MPSPPITIAPFDNVPAPGSAIQSEWAQDITNYFAGRVVHYYASTTARDDPSTGLVGAARRTGAVCMTGTSAGTGTAMPRYWVWTGTAWEVIGYWGSSGRPGLTLADAARSVPNVSGTDIVWTTETADPDGWVTAPNATLTVPTGLDGTYLVSYTGTWSVGSLTGAAVACQVGGTTLYAAAGVSAFPVSSLTFLRALAAGTTLKFQAYHGGGAGITIASTLVVLRVGR